MAPKQPDPLRELDALKGGLKHNPFAALRGDAASPAPPPTPATGRITVRIERTGRGGKTVTIAEGPGLHGRKLEPLAKEIARGMGTGARVESSAIVVQGDQRERLVAWLAARGFGGAAAGN